MHLMSSFSFHPDSDSFSSLSCLIHLLMESTASNLFEDFRESISLIPSNPCWSDVCAGEAASVLVTPKNAMTVNVFLCSVPSFYLHAAFVSTYI